MFKGGQVCLLTMGKFVWAPQQAISKQACGLKKCHAERYLWNRWGRSRMRPPNSKKHCLSKVICAANPHNIGYSGHSFLHWPSTMLVCKDMLDFPLVRTKFSTIVRFLLFLTGGRGGGSTLKGFCALVIYTFQIFRQLDFLACSLSKLMLQRTEVRTCKPETLQTAQEQRQEPTQLLGAFQVIFPTINSGKQILGDGG